MDDALPVGLPDTLCRLQGDTDGLLIGEPALSGDVVLQGDAFHQLHDDIVEFSLVYYVIGRHDIGMGQLCRSLGFVLEFPDEVLILRKFLLQDLNGHHPAKLRVPGTVNIGHAALSNLVFYFITVVKYISGIKHVLHRLPYTL